MVTISSLQSANDRHNHQQIYRSLTVQVQLPSFGHLFFLDVVVHSRALHQSIFILSSLFALASPMINMYYIPPYRRYVKSLLSANSQISPLKMSTDALHSGPRF
ncbi:hypothetical protein PRIPAC_72610 [Pristionchus pacificus]|uniref:G protein-coupled receptor n=1 Tax=Pristionchus pacificus TaxID=54126 RepID=A0A2A6C6C9_PRIPA|nr:hypothetical protein PRIPAC_72610 [Pristionchus pacificus]|eukprot:PDM73709.1 G protein-coupled receptor [Pristionchus pacificus]